MLSAIVTALSANTGTYLPFFENTLVTNDAGAVTGVMLAVCICLGIGAIPISKYFSVQSRTSWLYVLFSDFLLGLAFGLAMCVTNMTKLSATISFLDLRYWNPALAFVMGGAILVAATSFFFIRHLLSTTTTTTSTQAGSEPVVKSDGKPLLADTFSKPLFEAVDVRLAMGAIIFGVGWGLAGACPGPSLTNLGSGNIPPLIYNSAIVVGMWLQMLTDPHLSYLSAMCSQSQSAGAGKATTSASKLQIHEEGPVSEDAEGDAGRSGVEGGVEQMALANTEISP